MYYIRCATAAALLGSFMALLVSPAQAANILDQGKLPHGWEWRLVESNGDIGCVMWSTFTSIGTNPKVLPKGKDIDLVFIKRYNAPGAAFTLRSDHWSFPEGFTAKGRFSWNQFQHIYTLDFSRWTHDAAAVEASVSEEFVQDFAAKSLFTIALNGELVGGFPLQGSRAAMNALDKCARNYLPEWKEDGRGTPKRAPQWNGEKGDA